MTERILREGGPKPGGCATSTCVDAVLSSSGVTVTSTIGGNDGVVVFTHAEWDTFLDAVKGGAWDGTYSRHLAAVPA
jgi:hypothetical protein